MHKIRLEESTQDTHTSKAHTTSFTSSSHLIPHTQSNHCPHTNAHTNTHKHTLTEVAGSRIAETAAIAVAIVANNIGKGPNIHGGVLSMPANEGHPMTMAEPSVVTAPNISVMFSLRSLKGRM